MLCLITELFILHLLFTLLIDLLISIPIFLLGGTPRYTLPIAFFSGPALLGWYVYRQNPPYFRALFSIHLRLFRIRLILWENSIKWEVMMIRWKVRYWTQRLWIARLSIWVALLRMRVWLLQYVVINIDESRRLRSKVGTTFLSSFLARYDEAYRSPEIEIQVGQAHSTPATFRQSFLLFD